MTYNDALKVVLKFTGHEHFGLQELGIMSALASMDEISIDEPTCDMEVLIKNDSRYHVKGIAEDVQPSGVLSIRGMRYKDGRFYLSKGTSVVDDLDSVCVVDGRLATTYSFDNPVYPMMLVNQCDFYDLYKVVHMYMYCDPFHELTGGESHNMITAYPKNFVDDADIILSNYNELIKEEEEGDFQEDDVYRAQSYPLADKYVPLSKDLVSNISRVIKSGDNVMLIGNPGTGKTVLWNHVLDSVNRACLAGEDGDYKHLRVCVVSCHPDMTAQEFGYRKNGNSIEFGYVLHGMQLAMANPNTRYVLILEDISNCNTERAFSQVMNMLSEVGVSQVFGGGTIQRTSNFSIIVTCRTGFKDDYLKSRFVLKTLRGFFQSDAVCENYLRHNNISDVWHGVLERLYMDCPYTSVDMRVLSRVYNPDYSRGTVINVLQENAERIFLGNDLIGSVLGRM